jgi:hypothetical protein
MIAEERSQRPVAWTQRLSHEKITREGLGSGRDGGFCEEGC